MEVTLRTPPPLERALRLEQNRGARLFDGELLVAEAADAELELAIPGAVSLAEATRASERYPWRDAHAFPTCFTCGPAREDGLRIFCGPTGDPKLYAGPWTPDVTLPQDAHGVSTEIVWAALDCPGAVAAWSTDPPISPLGLLGRMTAEVRRRPRVGEACVALGWRIGIERRKVFAGTALYAGAELLAFSRQTWVIIETPKS
jgi:hypothetical protein